MAPPPNLPIQPPEEPSTPNNTGGSSFRAPSTAPPSSPPPKSPPKPPLPPRPTPIPEKQKPAKSPASPAPSPSTENANNVTPPPSTPPSRITDDKHEPTLSQKESALPPGHYEIRTMNQDLERLQSGETTGAENLKTKHILPNSHEKIATGSRTLESAVTPLFQKTTLFLTVGAAVLVIAVVAAWLFTQQNDEMSESSTPVSVQEEPPPPSPTLKSFFDAPYPETAPTNIATGSETIAVTASRSAGLMLLDILGRGLPLRTITHINLEDAETAGDVLSFTNIQIPNDILDALQSQQPRAPMLVAITPQTNETRFGLILPISDETNQLLLKEQLRSWESRMDQDTAILFTGLTRKDPQTTTFLDNTHNGIPLRYRNFADPNITIDYAIVTIENQPMLVITTSREGLFYIIDTTQQ